jgi:predicted AlkP superfamily phosphohydrolase/phosphomutase
MNRFFPPRSPRLLAAATLLLCLTVAGSAEAYVGPGAGVAFLTTGLLLVGSLLLTFLGLLFWPFRKLYRIATRKRPPRPPRIDRAIIIGLDGLDPDLVDRFTAEGRMPNLAALARMGTSEKLSTTFPAMSPVAWSSFATGVDPAKHGIFDFLTRDRGSYLPMLSSADIGVAKRHLKVGDYQIPIGRPQSRLLRKSKPFWKILGEHQVPASILRVPITFPPEPFEGTLLSAMCVPDLEGTQGSFSYYYTPAEDGGTGAQGNGRSIGGRRIEVAVNNGVIQSALQGPANPIRRDGTPLELPFSIKLLTESTAQLTVGREQVPLELSRYSDWVEVAFPMGLGLKLRGICRFRLLEVYPQFRLYVSPINIDPARPVMPISHPFIFSVFLAKLCGRFSTLGLAEDTWALNEGVLDEDAFLEQAWANHTEREAMFFEMLRRTPKGLVSCVFDGSDRIQHMFMRYLDHDHPAGGDPFMAERYGSVIGDTYARMDALVGQVMAEVDVNDPRTLLMVLSDHGFKTFRRGINLNSWLYRHGYLALNPGWHESGEWFRGVDWSRTRAFGLGLGGIFLNVRGREGMGVVNAGKEAHALAEEIAARLTGLRDTQTGTVAIGNVYPSHKLYKGPYADDAPDLVVGYSPGWRASWDGVRGIVNSTVFDDNTKAWSGDHCIDPKEVPGVLFCNQVLRREDDAQPAIADIAPTLLELFGIPPPRHMDGRSLASA